MTAAELQAEVERLRKCGLDENLRCRELQHRIEELEAELKVAEDALRRRGYRKSCDIPACNCGDQWNHGGHAEARLAEIGEVTRYKGATILRAVERLLRIEEEARVIATSDDWEHPYAVTIAERVLAAGDLAPCEVGP